MRKIFIRNKFGQWHTGDSIPYHSIHSILMERDYARHYVKVLEREELDNGRIIATRIELIPIDDGFVHSGGGEYETSK